MHKKILRIFAATLALLIMISVLPPVSAAEDREVERIINQIKTSYKGALSGSGRKNFRGYCASMVNWQLYLLDINTSVITNHGNMEYDYYARLDYTTGGHRVKDYSANRYNLKSALNLITEKGTVDAYNIIVGFQRTNTTEGRKYGHALLIHAILDGIVYFSESFDMRIGGKAYKEGEPIAVPIDTFVKYYTSGWAVYEGIICFGIRTYADLCQHYSSNFHCVATQQTPIYTAPCLPEVDERSYFVQDLEQGAEVHVTGLYKNTVDEYWYAISGDVNGYVRAEDLKMVSTDYSDITVSDLAAPNNLKIRVGFNLKGSIQSDHNSLYTVRAQVFQIKDNAEEQVLCATSFVGNDSYALYGSSLSDNLYFRKLPKGTYRYELAAVIGNYYIKDGKLKLEWHTAELWTSQFNIVSSRGGTCAVSFDANGGTTELNQIEVSSNSAIGTLPEAQREGYWFAGWYTAAEGGELISEEFATNKNVTLYAHWILERDEDDFPQDFQNSQHIPDYTVLPNN